MRYKKLCATVEHNVQGQVSNVRQGYGRNSTMKAKQDTGSQQGVDEVNSGQTRAVVRAGFSKTSQALTETSQAFTKRWLQRQPSFDHWLLFHGEVS